MGILVFSDAGIALGFAKALRENLSARDIPCRIGIDQSDVLLFRLGGRGFDVAGTAVNVASKLAQDCGDCGSIYVTESAVSGTDAPNGLPFSVEISRVRIRGMTF
jgi:class 3 adenylate cyclase